MKTIIYKYIIEPKLGEFEIQMPIPYKILTLEKQKGMHCIWVEHYLKNELEELTAIEMKPIKFLLVWTGQPFEKSLFAKYIGLLESDGLMFHLYCEKSNMKLIEAM